MTKEESLITWGKIKDEYGVGRTEEIFGINDPVEYQCDFITKIKDRVGSIEVEADVKRRDEDDLEVLSDKLHSIRYEVYGLEDDIEKIRGAIEDVREWGTQWKELCKKIILDHKIDINEIEL
ncbi:hypothetical protein [uncultured Metabacillus sp.]|uniref:hypothetical protein n=1 Tax=uncultured Metabacillus sp. TaxID=2860135 RepID=UPI0026113076|nr:hypothetical protein [uncultured Metabacillus sp.]